VNTSNASPLSNRVLKLNVGFLLSLGSGNIRDVPFEIEDSVQIADDLVAKSIEGSLRLSRTKEGLLVQTHLVVTVDRECARCLSIFEHAIPVEVEELYAYPHPLPETEFFIGQDAKLNLAPLMRAEILIALSHREYCREDCKGLCPVCGINRNEDSCTCESELIDPRMTVLKQLLDSQE